MTFILAICSVQKAPVQKNRLLSINGVVPPSHSVAPLLHIHTFPARRTDKTPSGQNYLGQTPSDVTPSSRLRLMPGRSLCLEGVMYGGILFEGVLSGGGLSRILPAHIMRNVSMFYKPHIVLLHLYHVLQLSLNKRHNIKQIIIHSYSEICLLRNCYSCSMNNINS